jgi:tetratricopeptide (TPR) repeat protein
MADRGSFLSPSSSRFNVSERRAVLVGRAAEMRDLERAYSLARDRGETRAVTIVGAAGIGKTRLVRDFLVKTRAGEPPRVYRGAAREGGATFEAFARVLRARFGLVEQMDADAAKAQMRAQAAAVLEDKKVGDVIYFMGQLLDLEFMDSPLIRAIEGDAEQLNRMRRAVIKGFFEADARRPEGTLVLVFDDMQWAHDESLDKLAYLIETIRAPALIICIARPEMLANRDGWLKHGGDRHTLVELSPLSDNDAAAVMQDLLSPCGDASDTEELIDAACQLAGGNPALLEQMVRIYLDTGVLESTDAWSSPGVTEAELSDDERWTIHIEKLAEVRLPLTVEDAVQARIAALTPAERELLERAATMGGVFWLGGLLAVQRLHQATPELWSAGDAPDLKAIRALLDDLIERDYVLRLPDSAFPGDEEYVFKHNLERDLLVKRTAAGTARRYHQAIAEWLAFKDSVRTSEEYLTMLARHREKSLAKSQAAAAYLQAADVARSQYAMAKAAELYAKGLDLIEKGAEADEAHRIRALHHYGDALQSLGKSDVALATFRAMLTHAFRLDQRAKGGAAHSRIGRLYRETGRLDEATQHLAAALALFEEAEDDRGIASTLDDIGKLHWLRGDYGKALEYTQRALTMRRRIGDRRSIALSLNNLGLVYQDSGQFAKALEAFEAALVIRREIGDLVGVSITLNNLGTVAQDQREDARAMALFAEALEVAKETGDRNRIALVLTNLGETHNRLGDAARAIKFLKQAEELADELGDKLGLAEAVRGLGKAYLAQREFVKARECTQRAVALFTEVQSRVQLGVALRSLGEVTAAASAGGPGLREAIDHVKSSIRIFEEVGNEIELARSCRIYADLLRTTPEMQTNPAVASEAARSAQRAADIAEKLKAGSFGLAPEALFAR